MQVGPGQRFSFLLHTLKNPKKQTYYLQMESREFSVPTRTFAVINYGPPETDDSPPSFPPAVAPITLPPNDPYWTEYSLRPYNNPKHPDASINAQDFPTAAEVTRRVNITSHLDIPGGALVYTINGHTWTENLIQEPFLVSLYKDGGKNWPSIERALQNDGLDPVTYAFPAEMGEVIEIVVQGTGSAGGGTETHPWHAHGAHYWDLGSGEGVYDREANEARWRSSIGHPIKREYVPPRWMYFVSSLEWNWSADGWCSTTNLYAYSGKAPNGELSAWRAWRLRIDHPGVWMIHCHLLPHMVWGMNSVSTLFSFLFPLTLPSYSSLFLLTSEKQSPNLPKSLLTSDQLQAWVMGNQTEVLSLIDTPDVDGYLTFGGSVNGNEAHPPEVVEYFPLSDWEDGTVGDE